MWVLNHDGHDVEEKDAETFRCHTCEVDIPKHPGRASVAISPSAELEDGQVSVDVSVKIEF